MRNKHFYSFLAAANVLFAPTAFAETPQISCEGNAMYGRTAVTSSTDRVVYYPGDTLHLGCTANDWFVNLGAKRANPKNQDTLTSGELELAQAVLGYKRSAVTLMAGYLRQSDVAGADQNIFFKASLTVTMLSSRIITASIQQQMSDLSAQP